MKKSKTDDLESALIALHWDPDGKRWIITASMRSPRAAILSGIAETTTEIDDRVLQDLVYGVKARLETYLW